MTKSKNAIFISVNAVPSSPIERVERGRKKCFYKIQKKLNQIQFQYLVLENNFKIIPS